MVTVREKLGDGFRQIALYDNPLATGGKSHAHETLGEFMSVADMTGDYDFDWFSEDIEACGIRTPKPDDPFDKYRFVGSATSFDFGIEDVRDGSRIVLYEFDEDGGKVFNPECVPLLLYLLNYLSGDFEDLLEFVGHECPSSFK